MTRRHQIALVYLAAFVAGLAVAYMIMRIQAGAIFSPGHTGPVGLRLAFAPVGAVAAFSLIYGIGRGRALRGRFWLAAVAALVVLWFVVFFLLSMGANAVTALGLVVLALLPGGLVLAIRADGD